MSTTTTPGSVNRRPGRPGDTERVRRSGRCPRCDRPARSAPCAACGARFDDAAAPTRLIADGEPAANEPVDFLPGATTVGGYRILRPLAGGGMSRVALAERLLDGRRIVVKGPPDRRPASRLRFTREVRALASLDHPNVVRMLDIDASADGTPVVVLDHVDGPSWRHLLAAGRTSLATVERLVGDLARALDHCHRRGVVHRDVKPDNVLVRHGHAVLIDFGLARVDVRPDDEPTATSDTPQGALLGTPPYAAPEQLGDPSRAGPAADIYGLGMILRESLELCRDPDRERCALYARLAERCCNVRPERRPPAHVLLEVLRRLPPRALPAPAVLAARRRRLPWLVAGAGAGAGLLTVLATTVSVRGPVTRLSGPIGSGPIQQLTLRAEPGTNLDLQPVGDTRIRLPGGGAWTAHSLSVLGNARGEVVIQVSDGDGTWQLEVR